MHISTNCFHLSVQLFNSNNWQSVAQEEFEVSCLPQSKPFLLTFKGEKLFFLSEYTSGTLPLFWHILVTHRDLALFVVLKWSGLWCDKKTKKNCSLKREREEEMTGLLHTVFLKPNPKLLQIYIKQKSQILDPFMQLTGACYGSSLPV